jgi:hypothetical protein
LVLILNDQPPAVVEALVLAASSARLGVGTLVQQGNDYRLELTPTLPVWVATPPALLEDKLRAAALDAAIETIQTRGEPTTWPTLHAAIQHRLARSRLLVETIEEVQGNQSPMDVVDEQIQKALESPSLRRMLDAQGKSELWWLDDTTACQDPLCDRVESAAYRILQDTPALTEVDFQKAIYAQFPGFLTPEADLVATCLRTFGRETSPGTWQLRNEDLPSNREPEREAIIHRLLALGRRLGYRAARQPPFDVAWQEREQVRAIFVVDWLAAVGGALALDSQSGAAHPYLVIPGGRGALASHKLSRNPLWQQIFDQGGWRFIKYRHVRQLAERPQVDEFALQAIVGLDPVVERESPQLALF